VRGLMNVQFAVQRNDVYVRAGIRLVRACTAAGNA